MDVYTLYWEWIGGRMVRDASRDVFDALQRLSPTYHARSATGESWSLVTTDPSSVYTATSALFVAPLLEVVTLTAIVVTAWQLDAGLTLLALSLVPVTAVLSRWSSSRLKSRATVDRRERVSLTSFVTNVIQSLPIVQAYSAEDHNVDAFRKISRRSVGATRRAAAADTGADAMSAVMGSFGVGAVLVYGGILVIDEAITVGVLIAFLSYVRSMYGQFRALLRAGRQARLAEVGLDRMHEVFDSDARIADPDDPTPFPTVPGGSSIRFENVRFGYDDDVVLDDFNLAIEEGQTVAIVGRTGAGKSTVLNLLCRLVDPWSGTVKIDGVDVRSAAVSDVRQRVAIVRQDPLILPATVAANIAIARPGADRDAVESAARRALAHDFIQALPDGYDTVLSSGESSLSGGQRQRLALARGFLKESSILVLDEPTSALDPESESLIVEAMKREGGMRTLIIVTHRLSTARDADRVVVLEHGRIAEDGPPDVLRQTSGFYARLHQLDLAGRST
jgi:ATP-binding cassette subfamily B protein/subfamily B ATP-binding cassette protein MsbA